MAGKKKKKSAKKKAIETIVHDEAKRTNIPTAEYQSVVADSETAPLQVAYERRNPDLDPQLIWRGKDVINSSDLVVPAPPLFIQEKIHPKALLDPLRQMSDKREDEASEQISMFADFNGLSEDATTTEFYQHDQNWTNRMILGDSLQVMASLAEREGLRGKVQCIYLDPPYGIKFNSNFQWSTTSRDVKDGKAEHMTRDPEQVKAFRDTWRDGVHSYLTYLRDRLTVARDLLTDSGSIFVQIGDENVHRVRVLMDEVFGENNFVSSVFYRTTGGFTTKGLSRIGDNILWYARDFSAAKFRGLCTPKSHIEDQNYRMLEDTKLNSSTLTKKQQGGIEPLPVGSRLWRYDNSTGQGASDAATPIELDGQVYHPSKNTHWKANYPTGMDRLKRAARLIGGGNTVSYKRYFHDYAVKPINAAWMDTGVSGFASDKLYVVQTLPEVVQRCILMATDPGDLILDPTCGSGTTAYVAEQWGRRWITIDTSRVALALARARLMGARYPYYLLADSRDGQVKEAELSQTAPSEKETCGNVRQGFVYERVPHITLKSIANNTEIDVIWEKVQETLEPLREALNKEVSQKWEEWEIPRDAEDGWSAKARDLHEQWWEQRIARQQEIDASIAAKADYEYLYDKPYEDKTKVRVAGPFTVESLSPHRTLAVGADDELIDHSIAAESGPDYGAQPTEFAQMILENLKTAGVQQAHKEDKLNFTQITGRPGDYVCAEGRYVEGESEDAPERRAGIFIGPEFGTVSRPALVAAAKEAADAGFDVLVACAFNYDAHASELDNLGVPVLKAHMNADLHMAEDLKNTGKGNLFVIFGEPDIDILPAEGEHAKPGQITVRINGVDVFHPQTGEVRSDNADGIACWFVDTDYNEKSFFVRHAYFLGANDPYKALKTTLKAEIDEEAWETLHTDTSRPFDKPASGLIAVKVINHLGDEVMKVFQVD